MAEQEIEACCGGACTQKQPILLKVGGLSGKVYAVTRWKARGDGIESIEKHDVTAQFDALLDDLTGLADVLDADEANQ